MKQVQLCVERQIFEDVLVGERAVLTSRRPAADKPGDGVYLVSSKVVVVTAVVRKASSFGGGDSGSHCLDSTSRIATPPVIKADIL